MEPENSADDFVNSMFDFSQAIVDENGLINDIHQARELGAISIAVAKFVGNPVYMMLMGDELVAFLMKAHEYLCEPCNKEKSEGGGNTPAHHEHTTLTPEENQRAKSLLGDMKWLNNL